MNASYREISDYLKKKIREQPFLESFEEEKDWLIEQMKSTIETGESSSALIVDLTKSSTTRVRTTWLSIIQGASFFIKFFLCICRWSVRQSAR